MFFRVDDDALVLSFNKRDEHAFGEVYHLLYEDLLYFSRRLYQSSDLIPEDTLQDLFMKLWVNKQLGFNSIEHVKAYMYTSIRNNFREYRAHQKVRDKYRQAIQDEDDRIFTCIVETEIIAELSRIPDILPTECAKVLKLYLEGWDTKDIARKLEKSPSTIYSQRQEIIAILKKILNRESFTLFLFFINCIPGK